MYILSIKAAKNSNFETRNPKQIPMTENPMFKTRWQTAYGKAI